MDTEVQEEPVVSDAGAMPVGSTSESSPSDATALPSEGTTEQAPIEQRKIFVGGLSFQTTEDHLTVRAGPTGRA